MQSVGHNLTETYEATPQAVAEGRQQLAEFAAAAGGTADVVDAVRLASSEAMTNSVLHAYRGRPGAIYVNAAIASQELWILISDDGCGLKPRADRPGLGLGLGLISRLSDDFAIVSRAAGGTEVRIRFNLSEDRSGGSSGAAAPYGAAHSGHSGRHGLTPSMSAA